MLRIAKLDIWIQVIGTVLLGAYLVQRSGDTALKAGVVVGATANLAWLGILFFRSRGTRVAGMVCQIAAIGAVYLAEFYLTVERDGLFKRDEISRLKAFGKEAYPTIIPLAWYLNYFRRQIDAAKVPLPLAGISNALTVYCAEASGWVVYQSDAQGFRNSGNSAAPVDIAIIGDSFAQGACVQDDHTIPAVLATHGWRAKSYGMASSGPLLELATLEEYALQSHPDAVVWLFSEASDLADLKVEATGPPIMKYLTEGPYQNLASRQGEMDQVLRQGLTEVESYIGLSDFLTLQRLRSRLRFFETWRRRIRSKPEVASVLPLLRRTLEVAVSTSDRAGVRFLFVYLPSPERYESHDKYYTDTEREVLSIACVAGAQILSMPEQWSEHDPLRLFAKLHGQYGHLNEDGYRSVANAIDATLRLPPHTCRK